MFNKHPFAVEAFFRHSLVLTYAVPASQLTGLIPPTLKLDLFKENWGFVAAALVDTSGLRPKGFPAFFGKDFKLTGYRIFVRYQTKAGKNYRGLYILGSETDKKSMSFFGNLFTNYNYKNTDITWKVDREVQKITSENSGIDVTVLTKHESVVLPPGSPFTDWKEARRFAGPLPFTFSYDPHKKTMLIVEGVRQNWEPQPVQVTHAHFSFLDKLNLNGMVLANAFHVQNVPYYWKKGRLEKWK